MARAAGVSIGAPVATKSFCMSTTIIAVLAGSISLICILGYPLHVGRADRGEAVVLWAIADSPFSVSRRR